MLPPPSLFDWILPNLDRNALFDWRSGGHTSGKKKISDKIHHIVIFVRLLYWPFLGGGCHFWGLFSFQNRLNDACSTIYHDADLLFARTREKGLFSKDFHLKGAATDYVPTFHSRSRFVESFKEIVCLKMFFTLNQMFWIVMRRGHTGRSAFKLFWTFLGKGQK